MTWTKLGDEFGPESGELTNSEFRTHVEALVYSNWRLLDLYVPKCEVRRFAGSPTADSDAAGLVLKGWWQDAGASWYVGVRWSEWQRDRSQVESRRAYLAEAQRRKRAHESGDHSRCLPSKCKQASTVDFTVDPGRDGTVTGSAVRPKVNSTQQPSPSPQTSDGSINGVPRAQHIPGASSADAKVTTVTRARTGRKPLPDAKRQTILTLHANGGLKLREIADQVGVGVGTVHRIIHESTP